MRKLKTLNLITPVKVYYKSYYALLCQTWCHTSEGGHRTMLCCSFRFNDLVREKVRCCAHAFVVMGPPSIAHCARDDGARPRSQKRACALPVAEENVSLRAQQNDHGEDRWGSLEKWSWLRACLHYSDGVRRSGLGPG